MTVKQKQCLLYYLGYYAGNIDGDWGTLSKIATKAFQKEHGLTADGVFGDSTAKAAREAIASDKTPVSNKNATGDFWDDIEYFTRDEFKCKCGGRYCNGYPAEMQEAVVRVADRARKHFGKTAYVISGLRDPQHNANEGGVTNSQHMYGEAIDLQIVGVTADQLLAFVQKQPEIRYAYAINATNVHFDIPKGQR